MMTTDASTGNIRMPTEISNLHLGSRGKDFKKMLTDILGKSVKPKYLSILTNKSSIKQYGKAFTSISADPLNNYEQFEQMGDVTANKFIVWYAYKRFPQLDCTEGVKIVARLRINYGAKNFFADIGEKLGFWPFISANAESIEKNQKSRQNNKKDLLEDCFEAFLGCTEYILDNKFRPGVGYAIVYDILSNIFDDINMSLKYEDLYDSKTRLKELFDNFKDLGSWYYINTREKIKNEEFSVSKSILYQIPPNYNKKQPLKIQIDKDIELRPQPGWIEIGIGIAPKKNSSQQKASEKAIDYFKKKGIIKPPPKEYLQFSTM